MTRSLLSFVRRRTGELPEVSELDTAEPQDAPPPQDTPPPVRDQLAMRAAYRNLAIAPDGLWAFYVLTSVDWLHKTEAQREAILLSQAHRWADEMGKRVWLRGTGAPFDHEAWADRVEREHPEADEVAGGKRRRRRLPDREGARSFDDLLVAGQTLAIELGARKSAVVLGVRVSEEHLDKHQLPELLVRTTTDVDPRAKTEKARRALTQVTTVVARDGFRAQPLAPKALEWLIHSSLGMGIQVPPVMLTATTAKPWDETKIPGFTAGVDATSSPYSLTTHLRAVRNSRLVERHVVVLHADEIGERNDTGPTMPLLAWPQSLDQAVEWCAVFDVVNGRSLIREAEYHRRAGTNIAEHNLEHGDDPPAHVQIGIDTAKRTEAEVTVGDRATATRLTGVLMLAVTGATAEDALAEADALKVAAAEQQGMTLFHDFGQLASYRAFTPCEPVQMTGHLTRWSAKFAAATVPNASTGGGDPTGFMVGNIAGGHDLYVFDTHGGSARNRSNMMLLVGDQGAGKSSLAGALADWTATLGIPTICLDPSGPWARLTRMPHLAQDSRHLDVAGMSPGAFAPSTLIMDPPRGEYETDAEWATAVADAGRERMDLFIDTFRDLLPYELTSGRDSGRLMAAIETATAKVGGDYGISPWEYVDALSRQRELGKEAAEILTSKARLKDGSLIFPPRGKDVDDEKTARMLSSAMLTVITMQDLVLPPKGATNRSSWTRAQLASVPILNLSARFATRAIYQDKSPCAVYFDETRMAANDGGSSFGTFLNRLSGDSRKWHALVAMLAQNASTMKALDPNIGNLAGSSWIGRTGDPGAAKDGLEFLRLPKDSGYDLSVMRLEKGEFLVRGWTGEVRRVVVDRSWWHKDLTDALDTTPIGEGQYDDAAGGLFGVA